MIGTVGFSKSLISRTPTIYGINTYGAARTLYKLR